MTDADVTRLLADARDPIAVLYERHAPEAVRFARLLTGNDADAFDVAHDAFLASAGRVLTLRSPDAFGAYLRRAVLREVQQRHRARGRRQRRDAASASAEFASDGAHDSDARIDMERALQLLPPHERAAIVLRYWLDLSEHDIARTLQCRNGTVKSRLSRGLATLREVLADD